MSLHEYSSFISWLGEADSAGSLATHSIRFFILFPFKRIFSVSLVNCVHETLHRTVEFTGRYQVLIVGVLMDLSEMRVYESQIPQGARAGMCAPESAWSPYPSCPCLVVISRANMMLFVMSASGHASAGFVPVTGRYYTGFPPQWFMTCHGAFRNSFISIERAHPPPGLWV